MLNDLHDRFKKIENLDDLILDTYIPADGTYLILKPNENSDFDIFSKVDIKLDKKTRDIDRTIENLNLLSNLDYNSKLLDMNKPIDGKKIIHSNNYLSFFIKKESLVQDKNGHRKLTDEVIKNYYEVLKDSLIKYKKKKAKEIYEEVESEIGKVNLERINSIQKWIEKNIYTLDIDLDKKGYLKIFFLFNLEDFYKEGKRYLIPNIFNSNDFNIKINEKLLGLPNDNMGLNSKKPYLENKTRKTTVPSLLSQEEVLFQKKIFDYLYNLACMGYSNIYIDDSIIPLKNNEKIEEEFSGLYFRIQKGKELEIQDFEIISGYNEKLKKEFTFDNYLGIDYEVLYKSSTIQYGTKYKLRDIEEMINEVLFSKYLINSYHVEKLSINDSLLKQSILLSRDKLFQWFYKGNNKGVWRILEKVSDLVIRNSIEKGNLLKGMNQFNLKYSLENYFVLGGSNMAEIISGVKEQLREKISEKNTKVIESDEEYFFAVGQGVSYLLSKSKSKNKQMSLINPIISAKSDEKIKNKIEVLFKKYNYDMNLDSDIRFKNLYAMILTYKPEGNVKKDLIIAGTLSNNLIYEKREK